MIDYVKGELAELTPTMAVVECAGVGYAVNISLNTYAAIQGKAVCKLYVYEAIREDAHLLFGFAGKQERELFLLLITVSGIGGNTARTILSSYSPNELVQIISSENVGLLKSVKGIGPKSAQRIIVDLKDKIGRTPLSDMGVATSVVGLPNQEVQEEALAALVALGFPQTPSQKVVMQILKQQPDATVETVIKLALKQL